MCLHPCIHRDAHVCIPAWCHSWISAQYIQKVYKIIYLFIIIIIIIICVVDNKNEVCALLRVIIKFFGGWLLPDVSFECWHCNLYFWLCYLYFGPANPFFDSFNIFSFSLTFLVCCSTFRNVQTRVYSRNSRLWSILIQRCYAAWYFNAIYFINVAFHSLVLITWSGLLWLKHIVDCYSIIWIQHYSYIIIGDAVVGVITPVVWFLFFLAEKK